MQHVLMQGAPLAQIQLLKARVAFHPEAVIHPPLDEANVKAFIHHKRPVVEDQIQCENRVVQPESRVPKGGVQILAGARGQERKLGLRRQRFRKRKPLGFRVKRRRDCHAKRHHASRQPEPHAPKDAPRRTPQPHIAEPAVRTKLGFDLQHST